MPYLVDLFPEEDTVWTDAWENFEREVWFKSSGCKLNTLLEPWKCRTVPPGIEFETEKDALFFLLRWS